MTCKTVTSQADFDAALADKQVECVHIDAPEGVRFTIGPTGDTRVEVNGGHVDWVANGGHVGWVDNGGHVGRVDNGGHVDWVANGGHVGRVASGGHVGRVANGGHVTAHGASAILRVDAGGTVVAGPRVAVYVYSAQARVTGGLVIDMTQVDLTDTATWCEHNGVEVTDGRAVLYKAVDKDLRAGHRYTPTTYLVGADMVAPDWRDNNSCGGGYHLSPHPTQASTFHSDASRWLRCTADLADLRPILDATPKCKVRALRVDAEVDQYARPLATALAG